DARRAGKVDSSQTLPAILPAPSEHCQFRRRPPKRLEEVWLSRSHWEIEFILARPLDTPGDNLSHCSCHRDASAVIPKRRNDPLRWLEKMRQVVFRHGHLTVPEILPSDASKLRIDVLGGGYQVSVVRSIG